MSQISDLIFNKFLEYNLARQPKGYHQKEPLPDYTWSTNEVRIFIETIANLVNSYLADKYLRERKDNKI